MNKRYKVKLIGSGRGRARLLDHGDLPPEIQAAVRGLRAGKRITVGEHWVERT